MNRRRAIHEAANASLACLMRLAALRWRAERESGWLEIFAGASGKKVSCNRDLSSQLSIKIFSILSLSYRIILSIRSPETSGDPSVKFQNRFPSSDTCACCARAHSL